MSYLSNIWEYKNGLPKEVYEAVDAVVLELGTHIGIYTYAYTEPTSVLEVSQIIRNYEKDKPENMSRLWAYVNNYEEHRRIDTLIAKHDSLQALIEKNVMDEVLTHHVRERLVTQRQVLNILGVKVKGINLGGQENDK